MARTRRDRGYRGTLAYLHTAAEGTPRLSGHVHRNFLAGAKRRATELGYTLDEFYLGNPRTGGRRFSNMFRARNIKGMVVEYMPGPACPNRRLPVEIGSLAVASIGVPLAHPPLHYVANDQYMRAILAARELLALGYRRLGLVLRDTFDTATAHRCSAGFWAVQEYIAEVEKIPICRLEGNAPRVFQQWLKKHKPDALLVSQGTVSDLLGDAGLRVPTDIGWAHLDWLPEWAPAAGVYGNSEHTGAAALELVVSQLHRGESGAPVRAMSYLVAGSWVPGKTVRRVGPALDLDTSFFTGQNWT